MDDYKWYAINGWLAGNRVYNPNKDYLCFHFILTPEQVDFVAKAMIDDRIISGTFENWVQFLDALEATEQEVLEKLKG